MSNLAFTPLLDTPLMLALTCIALIICLYTVFRMPLVGFWRLLAASAFLLFLMQPRLVEETTSPLPDIALIIADESASQRLDGRAEVTASAAEALRERLAAAPGTEVRVLNAAGESETRLAEALQQALTDIPRAQLSGIFLVTDGQSQDMDETSAAGLARTLGIDAPVHLMLTGREDEKDRVLEVLSAPRFGIINESVTIRFRIDDTGIDARLTTVTLKVNGREIAAQPVRIGEEITLDAPLNQPGKTVIELAAAAADGELTTRNNKATIQISVIRDRLRVLLVSGEPHAGERVWRNLLKSDPAVDLIHFTILKPATKPLVAAQSDLALIRFPENELFLQKLTEFDVLIFDRYTYRGVLNPLHFSRMSDYVTNGGAILIASGPEFAARTSIAQQRNLAYILPALPNGDTYTESFIPTRSRDGLRHPITAGLGAESDWGRWLRVMGVTLRRGQVLMEAGGGAPLLVVDRVGQGRVGLLMSDHVWLWAREFDGGGPHRELLRRLVHWLMKEPELEEDAVRLEADTGRGEITIIRRTLADTLAPVTLTLPDGTTRNIDLGPPDENGLSRVSVPVGEAGLYSAVTTAESGESLFDIVAFGLATPVEYTHVLSTDTRISPLIRATGGGVYTLRDGARLRVPAIRQVPTGRPATGRGADTGWAGIYRRDAARVEDVRARPLLPLPLWLVVLALIPLVAWLAEGWKGLMQRQKADK